MKRFTILSVFLSGLLLSCCGTAKKAIPETPQACISRVLAADDSIGKIRNRECMQRSLSATITNYTTAMEAIDTQNCPEAFVAAYQSHQEAWKAMRAITDRYPSLRGEMHVVFKELEQSPDAEVFRKRLAEIWTTWAEVEKFVKK